MWKLLDDQDSTPKKELELAQEDLCNWERRDKRKSSICGEEAVKEKINEKNLGTKEHQKPLL